MVSNLGTESQVRPLAYSDDLFSRTTAIIANRTTSIAIALATATVGGIFTSTATDMGAKVSPVLLT